MGAGDTFLRIYNLFGLVLNFYKTFENCLPYRFHELFDDDDGCPENMKAHQKSQYFF